MYSNLWTKKLIHFTKNLVVLTVVKMFVPLLFFGICMGNLNRKTGKVKVSKFKGYSTKFDINLDEIC